MLDWLYDNLAPFTVFTSSPFCNLKVGDTFEEKDGVYRLLKRDVCKVTIVKLNWWTRLWWNGDLNK